MKTLFIPSFPMILHFLPVQIGINFPPTPTYWIAVSMPDTCPLLKVTRLDTRTPFRGRFPRSPPPLSNGLRALLSWLCSLTNWSLRLQSIMLCCWGYSVNAIIPFSSFALFNKNCFYMAQGLQLQTGSLNLQWLIKKGNARKQEHAQRLKERSCYWD